LTKRFDILGRIVFGKSAIGEEIDNETLGGATNTLRNFRSYRQQIPNDQAVSITYEVYLIKLGESNKAGFDHVVPKPPKEKPEEIYGLVPADRVKPIRHA